MNNVLSPLISAALIACAPFAYAHNPDLDMDAVLEIQAEQSIASSDRQSDSFLTLEADAAMRLTAGWSVHAGLVIEPVTDDPGAGLLRREGAYIRTLNISYATARLTVSAGKIAPDFGAAWDVTPGIFGTEIAEAYELTEQLGARADLLLASIGDGHVEASASFFTADTSVLAGSVLRQRDRLRLNDGGAGNTGRPDSIAVSVNSFDVMGDGLHLHAAWRRLARANASEKSETAYVAGAVWEREGPYSTDVQLNAEYFYANNPGGTAGREWIATAGLSMAQGAWRWAASASRHQSRLASAPGAERETRYELGVGRQIHDRAGLDLSVSRNWAGDERETVLGLRLTLQLSS